MKKLFIFFALLLVVLLSITSVVGCQQPSTPPGPTPTSPPPTQPSVSVSNFAFVPQTLQVPRGTVVTWANKDSVSHTVSSRDNLFDSGTLPNGATFSYTFNQNGTFEYYCKIHPSMTGKIIVQ